MKGRESGMPQEDYWSSFFDADSLIDVLVGNYVGQGDVVEFGSGYGTFTIPASRRISGAVYGFDIEGEHVDYVKEKSKQLGLRNVRMVMRDFIGHGIGLPDASIEHVMIYNLLHIENPVDLLRNAFRLLRPGGMASVIHWRRDIPTPRGPSLEIRPSPAQCIDWSKSAGFTQQRLIDISACCPYHFGLLFVRPATSLCQEIT